MATTGDIVQKLWNLCHVLRDDGITYQDYVSELTWLLFLKMAAEIKEADPKTKDRIPEGYRWADLVALQGLDLMNFYKKLLLDLGMAKDQRVQQIFADASTSLRQPRNLRKLVENINGLDWYSAREEGLGDLYEGLLEKNASEKKSGAGQYFTPRALIDCMVALVKPQPGEVIQDPAAGTGGFLIAADRYMKERTDDYFKLSGKKQTFQRKKAFCGMELVPGTHRLCLMNALLHGIEGDILLGDTLSSSGADLPKADVILTNPPFGTKKGGGKPTRDDFTYSTSNKQLAFLQHIYRGLRPGGRAAVVLPDNVLFEEGMGTKIRADLMDKCNLHTILRLPTGIFYAQGVKTNVLFFERGKTDKGNTKKIWFYDMRTGMPVLGKRNPLSRMHFEKFMAVFRERTPSKGRSDEERFRCFDRKEIHVRGNNLDISWLKSESQIGSDDLPPPGAIAVEILRNLRASVEEIEGVIDILEVQ